MHAHYLLSLELSIGFLTKGTSYKLPPHCSTQYCTTSDLGCSFFLWDSVNVPKYLGAWIHVGDADGEPGP